MTTATIPLNKIGINFVWSGENTCEDKTAKKVELIFNNAKTKIHVELPRQLNANSIKKLPFILVKEEQEQKKTSILLLSAEQVNNFTLKAKLFSPDGEIKELETTLNFPEGLELGGRYNLIANLIKGKLSAYLEQDLDLDSRTKKLTQFLNEESRSQASSVPSNSPKANYLRNYFSNLISSARQILPHLQTPSNDDVLTLETLDKKSVEELNLLYTYYGTMWMQGQLDYIQCSINHDWGVFDSIVPRASRCGQSFYNVQYTLTTKNALLPNLHALEEYCEKYNQLETLMQICQPTIESLRKFESPNQG